MAKEYIDKEAFVSEKRMHYCAACKRRQGMKNGKMQFCYEIGDAPCRACDVADMLDYIEDFPAADVVEVVRCKDCKYCIKEDDYEFWCNGFCSPARLVNPEDFCSHGFNKSELCCCLNGTSEEAEAAIERVKARIGRVNNG